MALDIQIFDKIRALKAKFSDADDSSKQMIAEWEKRIQDLSLKEDFMNHAVTQEASGILKAKITNEIKYRLKTGLKDIDRQMSDEREKSYRFCLNLFNLEYEKELETLENLITAEL